MQVIQVPHTIDPNTPIKASIFLAGPCPRDSGVKDWRHDCVDLFRSKGFDGALYWPVPSANEEKRHFNLDMQVSWETKHLKMADIILFWMPRKLTEENGEISAFIGMTSNVEFGLYHNTGKVVMGHPQWAEKMRYIDWWCEKIKAMPIADTLESLVDLCLERLKNWGYRSSSSSSSSASASSCSSVLTERKGEGEQCVPLILWRSRAFQSWYQNQLKNNNKLLFADVEYVFQIPNKGKFYSAFIAILKAHIEIGNENKRVKDNEVILFRPDVAAVVPFYYAAEEEEEGSLDKIKTPQDLFDKVKIVLTSEFRSPCRNSFGNHVVEPPCGSSWDQVDFLDVTKQEQQQGAKTSFSWKSVAVEELHEEADIVVQDESRIIYVGSRQVASTLSAHHAHVYAVRLTKEEFEVCEKNAAESKVFGVEEDTERTSLKILTFGDVIKNNDNGLDWNAVGLISQTLMKVFF